MDAPNSWRIPGSLPTYFSNREPCGRWPMPRRTPEGIGQSIDLVRWLYWQVLRRSPIYQREVDTLLARWLKDARLLIGTGTKSRSGQWH